MLRNSSEAMEALCEVGGWAESMRVMTAWATAGHGKAAHWRALPLERLDRALIGIHFAQTEPWVLRTLGAVPGRLRVVEDTRGVFHPKMTLGLRGSEARAILGSSNFTVGGFGGNTELNVLLSGSTDEDPLRAIVETFDAEWSSARAREVDEDWLARYERAHARRPKPKGLPPAPKSKTPPEVASAHDLLLDWGEYYHLIASRERHTLANGIQIHVFDHEDLSYLQEIEACRQAFEAWPVFAEMPESARQRVTGWGPDTSGYFGRNGGAGNFKKLVRTTPEKLGRHLDRMPLTGQVQGSLAADVLNGLVDIHGVGLGVASRMLAVKRPDMFVTLNGANRRGVRAIFGRAPSAVKTYVDWHEQIWAFPWAQAPRPRAGRDERRVWRARVALMDTLIYQMEE